MDYTPKTDEEMDREGLLSDGKYQGVVLEAEETESKSGDPMVKLKVDVEGRHIFDYVSPHWFFHKFKHFVTAVGQDYEKGKLDVTPTVGAVVTATVETEPAHGDYKAKNIITDYAPGVAKAGNGDDDNLPF
ncbi:MAG: hypothetical protein GY906_17995 [bacterium]|nr:hypothetical protein [bacterium]